MRAFLASVVVHGAFFLLVSSGQAQTVLPPSLDPFGESYIAPQSTWQEQRVRPVVLQQYDRGCGPAALATVLGYVFDEDVTEEQLLHDMLVRKAEEEKLRGGFTTRDLMGAVERRGYETLAGRTTVDELRKLTLPAIVLLDRSGFRHFVVLWGVVDDRVHLGDPLIGNTTVPLDEFSKEWLGIVLIVLPPEGQMDEATEKVRRHVSYMEQTSLHYRTDPFAVTKGSGSLLGQGAFTGPLGAGEF